MKNEAGSVTQELFPSPVPASNSTLNATLVGLLGQERASAIASSPYYTLNRSSSANPDEFRETFERLVTDGTWRCVGRDVARHWAGAGGKVWVGEFRQGFSYPDNAIPGGYCETTGIICHEVRAWPLLMILLISQDDIYPTFGTAPNSSASITAFVNNSIIDGIGRLTLFHLNRRLKSWCTGFHSSRI